MMDNVDLVKKIEAIRNLADECLRGLSRGKHRTQRTAAPKEKRESANPSDYVLKIVNKIKNCDEADKIETEILDKISIRGRVLLPFYICYQYFPEQALTTGDVEKITGELRVKIKTPNVSKAIAESLQKYLDGDSTRARGRAVRYRLNRKGAKYFESLINPHVKK